MFNERQDGQAYFQDYNFHLHDLILDSYTNFGLQYRQNLTKTQIKIESRSLPISINKVV